MKALSSPESPRQRMRRVSKPVMEKRRRERINHSLETLRLLMLESTNDERLKNPKVEKAEILESVVHFLKTEKEADRGRRAMKRVQTRERPTCTRQREYQEGVRSCLLRIGRFISSESPGPEGSGGHASPPLPEPQTRPSSPGRIHRALLPAGDPGVVYPQHQRQAALPHPHLSHASELHGDTRRMLSATAARTHIADPVWRPWPQ